MTYAQIMSSVWGGRNAPVSPVRRDPIIEPRSNIVMKSERVKVLSSSPTLSLTRAIEGAIRIPQPTPKRAIAMTMKMKLSTYARIVYAEITIMYAMMKGFLRPTLSDSLPAGILMTILVTPRTVNSSEMVDAVSPSPSEAKME